MSSVPPTRRLVVMDEDQATRIKQAAESIARTVADMKRCQEDDNWPGHKGIYLANLEGFLGGVAQGIGDDLDSLAARFSSDEAITEEEAAEVVYSLHHGISHRLTDPRDEFCPTCAAAAKLASLISQETPAVTDKQIPRETVSGRVRQRFAEAEAKLRAAGDTEGATWAHQQAHEMEELVHGALAELTNRLADRYVEQLEREMTSPSEDNR